MFKNFDWKAALETLAFFASVCCFFFGIVLAIVYESWMWFLLWIPGSLIHALCAGMGG